MAKEEDLGIIMKALEWSYDKALNGIPGFDSAADMAQEYLQGSGTLHDKANRLIRWQNTKAATSGFITGLGGLVTLPVAIPANLASVLYVQIRMIAAIAQMGGHDVRSDQVKTMVYACLLGNAGKELIRNFGIQFGKQVAKNMIKSISGKTLTAINQKVHFRLITKFGEKGLINLGKAIPIVGGVVGGTVDLVATNAVGNIARDVFIGEE